MDNNLLRSWVGLPAGPWPPPDRELLGLPADGPVDPATVEAAALDRMARLRTHQLLHPDLVTEGMNRVAQAMMAVASGHSPRRQKPPAKPLASDFAAPPVETREPTPVPKVLDAVAVGPVEPPVAAVAPTSAFRRPPPLELIRIPADVPPPPGLALDEGEIPPHGRRAAYRELAGLRAVGRVLDLLRPSVALPGEGLLTPAAVCDLLEGVNEFRTATAHRGLAPGFSQTIAPCLTAVLSHPLPLALFRSLTRPQRLALAREWAGGRAGVTARLAAVRAGLDRPRRAEPWADLRRRAVGVFAGQPEVLLVAATAVLGVAAAVRTAAR